MPKYLPPYGDWSALAEMLLGPIVEPPDRERRRVDALRFAAALLKIAEQHELAATATARLNAPT